MQIWIWFVCFPGLQQGVVGDEINDPCTNAIPIGNVKRSVDYEPPVDYEEALLCDDDLEDGESFTTLFSP